MVKGYAYALYSKETLVPSLSFAWEPSYKEEYDIVKLASQATKKTSILVVIGYSFPFFNREIDREILANMSNLKKIYYQDMYASDLMVRLQSVLNRSIEIVHITEFKQFYLPYEL